jgi:iron(III) transport system substrate-binding protein
MNRFNQLVMLSLAMVLTGCFAETNVTEVPEGVEAAGEVTIYTKRHYDVDKELYARFTEETGIKVNIEKAKASELMVRMQEEGELSPADVFMTADVAALVRANDMGLLQTSNSEFLNATVPAYLKDDNGMWFGMTKRARIIVYSTERVAPSTLSTYEALTDEQWKGKFLARSSTNGYNQSLMAYLIHHIGGDEAQAWATGMVANMAQEPKGNDRDQVKFIAAGLGDVAVVNTYYIGQLLFSDVEEERLAGQAINVFFPNQEEQGTHINISGFGLCKHSPNKENAIKLMEWLLSEEIQAVFTAKNYEYPVNPNVEPDALLKSWGAFKEDHAALKKLGEYNEQAVERFEAAGWQ